VRGGGTPPEQPTRSLEEKVTDLRRALRRLGSLIVCFSGGIDSAFLLKVAVEELGSRAVALTAVSPSLPELERQEAVRLAREFGARHELIDSDEIHDPAYASNPTDRCFYCKQALFRIADRLKQRLDIPHVALGTNLDDLGDHRPGLRAARLKGALSPLVEASLGKEEVRQAARQLGIDIWDKPAFACLSSRFPYGTHIDEVRLNRVATCEALLHSLGFRVFRVRFHGPIARIEVGEAEFTRLLDPQIRRRVTEGCREAGFRFVSVDLEAYRSGRLNEGVVEPSGAANHEEPSQA
jgi:uncharacterized protein